MADSLKARGLGVRRGARQVLKDIDLDARPGELLAILGPNGAGKSTLLRALAGLMPFEGSLEIAGRPHASYDRMERARSVAFVPQRSHMAARLPVEVVVDQGRYAHHPGLSRPVSRDSDAVRQAMERMAVAHLARRDFDQLSYGEQRRVLLARALATGAGVLLLDEPTASLDIAHALSLFETLSALARDGRTVVLVLHQLDDALRNADTGLLLQEGHCVSAGPIAEVISEANVAQVYGVRMRSADSLGFELEPKAGP